MTNKERILSMNTNDLAKILYEFCENSERCYFCPFFNVGCAGETSAEKWAEWLEKPAEERKEV